MLEKKVIILSLILVFSQSCRTQNYPQFDAQRAFSYLQKQCEFGPRNPGSPGHQMCKEYLTEELLKYADTVQHQNFQYALRPGWTPVMMTNIIASFQADRPNRILLCAHWDTRPWADQDSDPRNRMKPVPGANDGASGVAVLLEIARILKGTPPVSGIDIVLFDGEDAGDYGNNDSWAIGSKEYARHYDLTTLPQYGILLDLVGEKDQQFYIEKNSHLFAPELVTTIWKKAEQLGITEFIPEIGNEVMDDHIRLFEAGIPCVDIIDLDYKYWHTTEDTPDKCSAQSLENVGRVVIAMIYGY